MSPWPLCSCQCPGLALPSGWLQPKQVQCLLPRPALQTLEEPSQVSSLSPFFPRGRGLAHRPLWIPVLCHPGQPLLHFGPLRPSSLATATAAPSLSTLSWSRLSYGTQTQLFTGISKGTAQDTRIWEIYTPHVPHTYIHHTNAHTSHSHPHITYTPHKHTHTYTHSTLTPTYHIYPTQTGTYIHTQHTSHTQHINTQTPHSHTQITLTPHTYIYIYVYI